MPTSIPDLDTFLDSDSRQAAITFATNAFYSPDLKKDQDAAKEAFNRNVLHSLGQTVEPQVFLVVREALEKGWQLFYCTHGFRPENEDGEGTPAQLEWEDKLDDMVADVFEGDLRQAIGISWTEEVTVDTQAFDYTKRDELALNAAAKYVEAIKARTVNKAMAAFGFVEHADATGPSFEKVWEAIKGEDAEATALGFQAARRAVEEILISYVHGRGEDLDLDELQDVLAQAADRDPLIASSAISHLGGEPDEHHPAFRIYATDAGSNWLQDVIGTAIEGELTPMAGDVEATLVEDMTAPEIVEGDPSIVVDPKPDEMPDIPDSLKRDKKAKKPKKGKKAKKSDQASGNVAPATLIAASEPDSAAEADPVVSPTAPGAGEGLPDPSVALAALQTLRDHTNMSDAEIGKELAVSRASVSSYARNKGKWDPERSHYEALRGMLMTSKTAIDAALMSLPQ